MAHIRSILPQRGGVAPVDNSTTALFHYDEHARDNIKSISPIGNQYSISFNGTNSGIDCGTSNALKTQTQTVECFVKFNAMPTDTNLGFVLISNYNGNKGMFLTIRNTGKAHVRIHDGTSAYTVESSTVLSINTWYHLAGVIDYNAKKIYVYVNGLLENSVTFPNYIVSDSSTSFQIGMWKSGSTYYDCLNGSIGNVRVWSRALSSSEVLQSMNNDVNLDKTGVVGYWRLNENQSTIARDYSSNGNDSIITAGIWAEGNAIYSLVSGGYPSETGKGVLVEEGTTNIIAANSNNLTGWTSLNHTDTGTTTLDPLGNTAKIWSVLDEGYTFFDTSLTTGQVYTASIYVYPNQDYTFRLRLGNNQTTDNVSVFAPANKWTRLINTKTADDVRVLIGYRDTDGAANPPSGFQVAYAMAQVEQKSYATSFTNGTRSNGQLNYSNSIINPTIGTISFWYKPQYPFSSVVNQNVSPKLFQIGEYYANSSFTLWHLSNTNGDINLYVKGATSNGWSASGGAVAALKENQWTFIAVSWNGVTWKLYVDGILKNTMMASEALGALNGNYIYIGGDGNGTGWQGRKAGSIVDELRIDNIARTDTEIASWYYQGRNGW